MKEKVTESLSFGTDGVRAEYGEELERAAYALGRTVHGRVVLGRDTRVSGERLAQIFAQGASDAGAQVEYAGIMPTAGVAYLTKSRGADFGAVISASHNPPEYNGIKIFSSEGEKLSEQAEAEFDAALRVQFEQKNVPLKMRADIQGAREEYINFLCGAGRELKGMKIALDCANGAASVIAPQVFARLGADTVMVSANIGGLDINDGCGALHIDTLKRRCPGEFDIYFAFDGDADRVMALSDKGEVMDGDLIMYTIAALTMQNGGRVSQVVGTVMSNGGTEEALKKLGVKMAVLTLPASQAQKTADILVDAGVSYSRLNAALRQFGLSTAKLDGVVVTHEHTDHIKGVQAFCDKYGVKAFISPLSAANAYLKYTVISRETSVPFDGGISAGDMYLTPFRVHHDAAYTVGYQVEDGHKTLCIATDLGYVTAGAGKRMSKADAVILESNHDKDMLENGKYPYPLKVRIAGKNGHLSNDDAAYTAVKLVQAGVKRVILAHLSQDNNTPQTAYNTVMSAMTAAQIRQGKDVKLDIAYQFEPSLLTEII